MNKKSKPNSECISLSNGQIITFGLTEEQNSFVQKCIPQKGYTVMDTDVATDLIAIFASAIIINSSALSDDDREMICDYYREVSLYTSETVFWLGEPKPIDKLKTIFKCYQNFDELKSNLKYLLLTAHSKSKKTLAYSKQLANGLRILSLIRNHPGIKRQEIADIMEMNDRSVQRYISSLQAAGEWLEYDRSLKGWTLQHGVSILFGDCWDDK